MIPVVYVNCDVVDFVSHMMDLSKPIETRTRNTLRAVVGRPVLIAETRHGQKPVVRCLVQFGQPLVVESREAWETVRAAAWIPADSRYDWQPNTKRKWLYPIEYVQPLRPFTPPEGVRHGRVWMEYNGEEVQEV